MKLDPRAAIHIEKLLLTAGSWVPQSLRRSPERNSVSQVDGVSHMAPLASSVALPTFLSGRKLSPNSCLDASHFSSSLYSTGAFQAATLVLEPRGSESE